MTLRAYSVRYRTLDMWRGLASFGIVLHHVFARRGLFTDYFYLFVQLFFVISGYCLASALDRAQSTGLGFSQFMKRRIRRIAPPYVSSVILALCVLFVADHFGHAHPGINNALRVPWWYYATNVSMTQWVSLFHLNVVRGRHLVPWGSPVVMFLSPVYWSVNYEEQFYLIMGVMLLFVARRRPFAYLMALTAIVCGLNLACPDRVTGLFVDYWLQFAVGIVVYIRLCVPRTSRRNRLLDFALVLSLWIVAAIAMRSGQLSFDSNQRQLFSQLGVCIVFAIVLVALRRCDDRAAEARWLAPLAWVGSFSYSLYLVHYPLLRVTRVWRDQFSGARYLAASAISVGLVVAVAYVFYRLVERPFVNSRSLPPAGNTARTQG